MKNVDDADDQNEKIFGEHLHREDDEKMKKKNCWILIGKMMKENDLKIDVEMKMKKKEILTFDGMMATICV